MKTLVPILSLILYVHSSSAQITTPILKAGFGVDGELRANFFMNIPQSGNDDWFSNSFGSGQFVIDTTGAAQILSNYISNPASRQIPFFRTMRVEPYTLVNGYRLIDGVFIRDYHGTDSTIFASGSNKNGMSPADWSCPIAQSVPDKNEILDMLVHVRRAGPNSTDSLWMFGGLSIENTTGSRYFDFEMYQTDIYYDRASRRFYGYGSDAGHTAWLFDASGNITRPGDIIFSAEFSSSNVLTNIEARIWIDQASMSISTPSFNWSGSFDGAVNGAQYGYAGISPKTVGAFYTGLTSPNNTWAGPFSLVLGDNSMINTYTAGQFMEFSVNLTKLGLDPVTLLGGDDCGMPFRRVLVKTRASTSFTASLKDFVGPFDFFLAPRADADADVPYFCGTSGGVSALNVINPVSTSIYTWSTLDGNISGTTTGPSTTANAAGTYIVTQTLQSGCSTYATDTVVIVYDPICAVLPSGVLDFQGTIKGNTVELKWHTNTPDDISYFVIERSYDNQIFTSIDTVKALDTPDKANYSSSDNLVKVPHGLIYYRLKTVSKNGHFKYSRVLVFRTDDKNKSINILPNPARSAAQINISAERNTTAILSIYHTDGRELRKMRIQLQKGNTSVNIDRLDVLPRGVHTIKVDIGYETFTQKLILL